MFQDIRLSKSLSDEYRTYCGRQQSNDIGMKNSGIDFSVMVLTLHPWKFSVPPNLILPFEVRFKKNKRDYFISI
jgi:hypothetical protein